MVSYHLFKFIFNLSSTLFLKTTSLLSQLHVTSLSLYQDVCRYNPLEKKMLSKKKVVVILQAYSLSDFDYYVFRSWETSLCHILTRKQANHSAKIKICQWTSNYVSHIFLLIGIISTIT